MEPTLFRSGGNVVALAPRLGERRHEDAKRPASAGVGKGAVRRAAGRAALWPPRPGRLDQVFALVIEAFFTENPEIVRRAGLSLTALQAAAASNPYGTPGENLLRTVLHRFATGRDLFQGMRAIGDLHARIERAARDLEDPVIAGRRRFTGCAGRSTHLIREDQGRSSR
ncbi:hypothetical protein LAZ40_04750 [Cereibacter sphaeroides]|uniref:hypothetical protein n=1 Tax=Cereibacter sphaeroides TaxID=1063 RepID=UPI001F16C3A9|nr:hypothetical protein [Cereibacter sphaeroides]MCE6958365.1 hypothetical protein [Cereibacter sphaeroides]MCE6972232.1 hypothetical protein [Cereibacter sphaeroides]